MHGLDREDIKTTIKQDEGKSSLEIKVSKDHHKEIKDNKKGLYLKEEGYAKFSSIFGLGKEIIAEKVKTKYENGIFEVIIPKK